jgi:UDP-glucose 4-epimerase
MSGVVAVTGASGFLGSWICHSLISLGFQTFALTRNGDSNCRLDDFPVGLIVKTSPSEWDNVLRSIQPEVVISADWSGVDSASRNSREIQFSNIDRVVSLAKTAVNLNVRTFITFGSQAENGPINFPAKEVNYDRATTHYGLAKIQLRKVLEEVFLTSSTRFVWGRIFSTYGPLDNPNWLLPSLIDSLIQGRPYSLTSGKQVWSYLHALDFSNAVISCMENDLISGVVNIGNEEIDTIEFYAKLVGRFLNRSELLSFGEAAHRPDQVMLLQPETTKLNKVSWKTKIGTEEGIQDLVDWHLNGTSAYDHNFLYK